MITMAEDRITQLPQHIKEQILSLCPLRIAVSASALSRAWKNVWLITHLNLVFDSKFHTLFATKIGAINLQKDKKSFCREIDASYFEFIDRVLAYRVSSDYKNVESLSLFLPRGHRSAILKFDEVLSLALDKLHVQVLDLSCNQVRYHYELPNKYFVAGCLRKLKVSKMFVNDELIQVLASSCPLLESLTFHHCHGLRTPNVSGFPRLLSLDLIRVFGFEGVKIDAPSLRYLNCIDDFRRIGQPIEKDLVLDVSSSCKLLRRVFILFTNLTQCSLTLLQNLLFLETLSLKFVTMPSGGCFAFSSQCLKYLTLIYCNNLIEVKINAPNLKHFKLWRSSTTIETIDVKIFAPNLINYENNGSVFNLHNESDFSALRLATLKLNYTWNTEHLITFLDKLKYSYSLDIMADYSLFYSGMIKMERLRDSSISLIGVEDFTLALQVTSESTWKSECNLDDILDTLIKLCPLLRTITIKIHRKSDDYKTEEEKIIKFKCKEDYRTKTEALCWKDCLEPEVEIKTMINYEVTKLAILKGFGLPSNKELR